MILAAAMNPEALSGVEDIVVRMRRGDPDALTAMISRYQHRLYRYLLRLVREPAAADDLFQQTWLRVMEKIGRYDAQPQFRVMAVFGGAQSGRRFLARQTRRKP